MTDDVANSRPVAGITDLNPAVPLAVEQSTGVPERLPELTFGRTPISVERVPATVQNHSTTRAEADLSHIEACCRLKAEGARWAASRHRRILKGANFAIDIAPGDRALIARARELSDCLLWMCQPHAPAPSDFGLYEVVAGCFEAVADVVVLLRQIQDDPAFPHGEFEMLLNLLAEAQSSLRVAIATSHGPADTDQLRVFNWLKETASRKRIFIERYMRIDDPADPSQWGNLYVRIGAVGSVIQETKRRDEHRRKLLEKLRQKLLLPTHDPAAAVEEWQDVVSTVEEMVNAGLQPSSRELRDLLIPVIDRLPDLVEIPRGFQLVLREIDRFLATNPAPDATMVPTTTMEVRQVARLMKGRSMVLIGGDRRPASEQALRDAFNLLDVIWIETREHESIGGFEASIARSDVAIVVLAIRWSSHSFGDVRAFCDRHGKPLVRLPGGYNPNQVAAQILSQCSGRLELSG